MSKKIKFGNVITAMITPFTKELELDYNQAVEVANYLIDTGTNTLLLAGTTGESPTLTHDEEFQLFKTIKASVGSRAHVMAGTGSNCTKTAIQATKKALDANIDSVLQVVPYYNKPSQEGMYQHFSAVANASKLPIMLYNIPSRTGSFLEPDTVLRLSAHSTICSIKEAAGSVETVEKLASILPTDFLIYSGDDGLTLEFLKKGATGVVSVASHCVGNQIQDLIQAFHNGDILKAERISTKLDELFNVLFITSNPVPVKYVLSKLKLCLENVRLPLVTATQDQKEQINTVLQKLDLV